VQNLKVMQFSFSMVDEKIAALAAEYEKARKQNIQLRDALKAKDRCSFNFSKIY